MNDSKFHPARPTVKQRNLGVLHPSLMQRVGKESVELLHPTQGKTVIQSMVNPGIVQNDKSRHRLGDLRNQALHEIDEGFAVVRRSCLSVIQARSGKVQGAHDHHALIMRWRHCMRTTDRRRSRKARLIVIEQQVTTFPCPSLQAGKSVGTSSKSFRVAVFLKLIRMRLKLNPLFLRMPPSRSSDSGKRAPVVDRLTADVALLANHRGMLAFAQHQKTRRTQPGIPPGMIDRLLEQDFEFPGAQFQSYFHYALSGVRS